MSEPTPFPSGDPTWMLDLMIEPVNRYRVSDRTITYCNAAWAQLYTTDADVAIGMCLDAFLSADEMSGLHSQLTRLGPEIPSLTDHTARAIRGADDRWLEWVDHYVVTDQGPEILSIGRDVTDRHRTERSLAESEARFRGLADNTADVLWRTHGRPIAEFEYISPSVERVLGYSADWLIEDFSRLVDIAEPSTRAAIREILQDGRSPRRLDLDFRHAEGHVVIGETSITFDESGAQGVMRDVTELRFLQRSLSTLAATDALTSLWNRRRFDEELAAALGGTDDIAVVFVDLDDLKGVNDRFGHEAGDIVLQAVARQIASRVDGRDIAARLGGDEFAIIHHVRADSTHHLVADLDQLLRMEVVLSAHDTTDCSASVGAARATDVSRDPHELVAAADRAMYLAKRRCRSSGERPERSQRNARPTDVAQPHVFDDVVG